MSAYNLSEPSFVEKLSRVIDNLAIFQFIR